MKLNKISVDNEDNFGLKSGDKALLIAQRNQSIDWAGPLAGHPPGVLKLPTGQRLLVTSGVKQIKAERGPFERLRKFFTELLGGEQRQWFFWWLKCARESLLEYDFRPGQLLVLAGPSGCGKSLLQSIITEFLGGRSAKPYRYMTDKTTFNSDLAGAEHLVMADEQASTDIRSRRNFGAAIKDQIVNREMSLHAKGKDAIAVPTYKRLTLSLNNESENLMILPPMDESIMDKVTLFNCSVAQLSRDRVKNWKEFISELPHLAYYVDATRIPDNFKCPRYGVIAFHNPDLFEAISDVSPEMRLMTLIDELLQLPFTGSADSLEHELRNTNFRFAVEKLLCFPSACGTYLSRLERKYPDRISHTKNTGKTVWKVKEVLL